MHNIVVGMKVRIAHCRMSCYDGAEGVVTLIKGRWARIEGEDVPIFPMLLAELEPCQTQE